jgi:hypothetical protein
LPLSISTCSSTSFQPAVEKGRNSGALRFKAEAACALPLGADAEISNEFAVMFDHSVSYTRRRQQQS